MRKNYPLPDTSTSAVSAGVRHWLAGASGRWMATTGLSVGVWLVQPKVGIALAAIALVLAVLVVVTALFGCDRHGARAFRLLGWVSGRPEPAAPGHAQRF